MPKKFDGCEVIETTFGALNRYERFFDANGTGYAKDGPGECVDDYCLDPILIDSATTVFVKAHN